MAEALITVIVPVYKVEAYLERAILSVLNQTYQNLQIILVDDGSPDNCGSICDAYEKKDSRIRVIHKKNGGLSDARNAGLEAAEGDYIAFLDSDDFIAPFFLETLMEALLSTGSDVALCPYQVVKESGMTEFMPPPEDKEKRIIMLFMTEKNCCLICMIEIILMLPILSWHGISCIRQPFGKKSGFQRERFMRMKPLLISCLIK